MSFDAAFDPDEQDVWAVMHLHRRTISEEQMRKFEADVATIFEAFGLDLHTPATERTPQRFLRAMSPAGVLTAGVQLPATRYDNPQAGSFFRESLSRISALPGVQRAAGAACLPVPFACIGTSFWRADRPTPADTWRMIAFWKAALGEP